MLEKNYKHNNEFVKHIDLHKEPDRKKAEDLKKVRELLVRLGYDENTEIESNPDYCEHNVFNGILYHDASHNFMWHEIDSGKLIIVTDGFGPLDEFIIRLLYQGDKPQKVIFFEWTLNGHFDEKTEIGQRFKDEDVVLEIIPK